MSNQPFPIGSDLVDATMTFGIVGGVADDVVTAVFRYSVLEPFAVRASFALPDSPAVEWVLSRDILREGLIMPSGLGDIRVLPTHNGIAIELLSPQGRAVMVGDVAPMVDFVQRAFAAVPDGREDEFFSIDAELDMLAAITASTDTNHPHGPSSV